MTPRERADRAKQILDDSVFNGMLKDLREQIVAKLESCPVADIDAQHELTITLQLLKQMRTQLMRYTEEIVIDNAVARNEQWLKKARRLLP